MSKKEMEIYEYGTKFDFTKVKPGDTVIITNSECSFNHKYPNKRYYQQSIVEAVDSENGYIIVGGFKFKQDKYTTYLYPGYKEIEYSDRLKISTTKHINIASVDNKHFYNGHIHDGEIGWPTYLFLLTNEWKNQIKEDTQSDSNYREEEMCKNAQIKAREEMIKPHQDAYNEEIDPLVKKLKELEKKILSKRQESFNKHFCQNCSKNYGNTCEYLQYYDWAEGIEKPVLIENCQFFEEK